MLADNYDIDIEKIAFEILPSFYNFDLKTGAEKRKFREYIKALLSAMNDVNNSLYAKAQELETLCNYTGQHLSVVKLLNDKFDNSLRRIYITELNSISFTDFETWYLESETDPLPKTWYLYGEADPNPKTWVTLNDADGLDFTIFFPTALAYNEDLIRSLLSNYVMADKTYKIDTF